MPHWTEDVWVEQPELFVGQLESRFDQAPEQVDAVLSLLAAEYDLAPKNVLDVACGIGRHVVAFARAGIEATGVDVSPDYVQRARERARAAGVADSTTVVERDMRDLREVSGRYDLVTSMFTSFGFYDDETNRAVLEDAYSRLTAGGALLIEVANKEGLLSEFDADGANDLDGQLYVETREYEPDTSRIHTTVRVLDEQREEYRGSFSFDLRLYAPVELAAMLERAGFRDVRLYASLDADELARDSTRMVLLGRRG